MPYFVYKLTRYMPCFVYNFVNNIPYFVLYAGRIYSGKFNCAQTYSESNK